MWVATDLAAVEPHLAVMWQGVKVSLGGICYVRLSH